MSLLVNAFKRGESGEIVILEPNYQSEELAGPEGFRNTFYGGQTARNFGLRLLPVLTDKDLYVEGADIDLLQAEVEVVLQNIEHFVGEAGAEAETLRFRMENIMSAIAKARAANGGVVLW